MNFDSAIHLQDELQRQVNAMERRSQITHRRRRVVAEGGLGDKYRTRRMLSASNLFEAEKSIDEITSTLSAKKRARATGLVGAPRVMRMPGPTPPMLGLTRGKDNKGFEIAVRIEARSSGVDQAVNELVQAAKGEADVRVVGRIEALSGSPSPLNARSRPIKMGSAVGHKHASGSVGCFVRRVEGRLELLSNNHVLVADNNLSGAEAIYQPPPGPHVNADDRIGHLSGGVPLEYISQNLLDAALCELDEITDVDQVSLPAISHLAGPTSAAMEELLGEKVAKMGAGSGPTSGEVSVVNFAPRVWYGTRRLNFAGQIEIESGGDRFSGPGDSGSLIYTPSTVAEGVALLFAGTAGDYRSWATPIHVVLDTLNLTIAV